MRLSLTAGALVVDLGSELRCLSSAVLGGGLATMRTWIDLQVPAGYARTDPARHLEEIARRLHAPRPVVGMLTAAEVSDHVVGERPHARAVGTVGVGHPLAAAGVRPRQVPPVGTINLLVVVEVPLDDAGLAGALATAVEAKAQALADAGIGAANHDGPATGTATDSLCVACPPGASECFAGPATAAGAAIAGAVHEVVLNGALASAGRERRLLPLELRRRRGGSVR